MEHSFDIEIAREYGIPCAIVLKHLYYWIDKNRQNDKHYYDGCYWTYNSVKAFSTQFPYLSEKQIRTTLSKLEEQGLIKTANYNTSMYDRTKWYALTRKGFSILLGSESHLPIWENGNSEKGEPIPDINTYINTNNLSLSNDNDCQTDESVRQAIEEWNTLKEYGVDPVKRINSTSTRYKCMNARIKEYGIDEVIKTIQSVKHSDFLLGRTTGRGGHQFFLTFDWFVKPNNFEKVYSGNYLNRDARRQVNIEPEINEYEGYQ